MQTKKQVFALALALWALSACSQDKSDTEVSATGGGETITFGLSVEVSVDDAEARAINYKLGKKSNGEIVPMPEFTDGQEVDVHTIIKSNLSDIPAVAQTLKWRYDAKKKKLVLKPNSHNIPIEHFNDDNSRKWYISGLIGGALNGTQVEFMGTRVLKGVDGNVGDALASMEVPYAFGWTELTITQKVKEENSTSYRYVLSPSSPQVKFQPLGSLLAVKLGTAQKAGAYTFTPRGFTISSNAWGDQGTFNLDTAIPSSAPQLTLPTWAEAACGIGMYYTFASGEEPGAIAHNQISDKTYYVWVMPHTNLPSTATVVRVMMQGVSSRPETETYKDYTNTWFTDYAPKASTGGRGRVTQGKVHPLTARVSHRLSMPIEHVTEYNLAGGTGLTYMISDKPSEQPDGVLGDLRFATSHRNDQSGYYNWYKVLGRHHNIYNPDSRNLQTEVDRVFGVNKYYVPTAEEWNGVYPTQISWGEGDDVFGFSEFMSVGSGSDKFKQIYLSSYLDSLADPYVGYSIRFIPPVAKSCDAIFDTWYGRGPYPLALDNSMKCAYRFRYIGTLGAWFPNYNRNLDTQIIIDVVYLGEEASPTELSTISNDDWWADRLSEKRVITRTFPAAGWVVAREGRSPYLENRGSSVAYWMYEDRLILNGEDRAFVLADRYIVGNLAYLPPRIGMPVRLFEYRE